MLQNLEARSELNDAWANVALSSDILGDGTYEEALSALMDAERHSERALAAVEWLDHIMPEFDEIEGKIAELRTEIRIRMATSVRTRVSTAAAGA